MPNYDSHKANTNIYSRQSAGEIAIQDEMAMYERMFMLGSGILIIAIFVFLFVFVMFGLSGYIFEIILIIIAIVGILVIRYGLRKKREARNLLLGHHHRR